MSGSLLRKTCMMNESHNITLHLLIKICHGIVGSVFLRFFALSRFVSSSCHSPSRVASLHCFHKHHIKIIKYILNTYPTGNAAGGSSCLKYGASSASTALMRRAGSYESSLSARSRPAGDSHLEWWWVKIHRISKINKWTYFWKSSRKRSWITSRGFTSSYQGKSVTPGHRSGTGVPRIL